MKMYDFYFKWNVNLVKIYLVCDGKSGYYG